jgi:hypothetical protein
MTIPTREETRQRFMERFKNVIFGHEYTLSDIREQVKVLDDANKGLNMAVEADEVEAAEKKGQSVQSVSDCSVSSSVGLFCFSQLVEDYFRVSQSVRIKGTSY